MVGAEFDVKGRRRRGGGGGSDGAEHFGYLEKDCRIINTAFILKYFSFYLFYFDNFIQKLFFEYFIIVITYYSTIIKPWYRAISKIYCLLILALILCLQILAHFWFSCVSLSLSQ